MHHVCTVFDVNFHCGVNGEVEARRDSNGEASSASEAVRCFITAALLSRLLFGCMAGWILDRQYLWERLWTPLCLRAPLWKTVGGWAAHSLWFRGAFIREYGAEISLLEWVKLSQLSGWNLGQSALTLQTRTSTGPWKNACIRAQMDATRTHVQSSTEQLVLIDFSFKCSHQTTCMYKHDSQSDCSRVSVFSYTI